MSNAISKFVLFRFYVKEDSSSFQDVRSDEFKVFHLIFLFTFLFSLLGG